MGCALFGPDVIDGPDSMWCDTLYEVFRVALVGIQTTKATAYGVGGPGSGLQCLLEAVIVAALRSRKEGEAE